MPKEKELFVKSLYENYIDSILDRFNCSRLSDIPVEDIKDEIVDISGAIQNERIWMRGSSDSHEAAMHHMNIKAMEFYEESLVDSIRSR